MKHNKQAAAMAYKIHKTQQPRWLRTSHYGLELATKGNQSQSKYQSSHHGLENKHAARKLYIEK